MRAARTDRKADHHVAHDLADAIRIHSVADERERERPDADGVRALHAKPNARSSTKALQDPSDHECRVVRSQHEEDDRAEHQTDCADERPSSVLDHLAEDANRRRRNDQPTRIRRNEPARAVSGRVTGSETDLVKDAIWSSA